MGDATPVEYCQVLFTGHYSHTIDSKGRLAIPADIRGRWRTEVDGGAWYAVPSSEQLIRLYTETSFHQLAANRSLTLTPDEDESRLESTLFGLTERAEMDAAGRIRLSDEIRKLMGIGTEVVLVGAGDRLEIHDKAAWDNSISDRLAQMSSLVKRISDRKQGRGS